MAGSTEFKVNIVIQAKDKSAPQTKKAANSLDKLIATVKKAAVAFVVLKTAKAALDFAKLGANVQATENRFIKFAGGADKAAEFLGAFQEATDGTVDRMAAMQGGARLLQMGLVDSSEEMGVMAAIATKLGDQTMSAGNRIGDFGALLANKSIPRLDNFGIASGKVREEVERLKKAGMDADQAFKLAVIQEGTKSLAILGDTSGLATTKIGIMEAQWKNTKDSAADLWATIVVGTGLLDTLGESATAVATKTAELPAAFEKWQEEMKTTSKLHQRTAEEYKELAEGGEVFRAEQNAIRENEIIVNSVLKRTAIRYDQYQKALKETAAAADASVVATNRVTQSSDDLIAAQIILTQNVGDSSSSFDQYTKAVNESMNAMDNAAMSAVDYAAEQRDLAAAAELAAQKQNLLTDQAMNIESANRNAERQQEDQAQTLEDIEAEHTEKVAALQKKTWSRAVKINEEGELEKLETLENSLAVALQRQSEFTDKTALSTQMSKENQIAKLQGQINDQSRMLEDYYAGRLVSKGANITTELAAENARYAEELRIAEEQHALQEAEQRRSLGQQRLQHLEAWAAMNKIGQTEVAAMRQAIALEYGLMTEASVTETKIQEAVWAAWAKDTSLTMAEAAASIGIVIDKAGIMTRAIDAIPTSKTIDIKVNVQRGGAAIGGMDATSFDPFRFADKGAGPGAAGGANFTVPPGFENDSFPMRVSSGEKVIVIPRDQTTTTNNNLTVNTQAQSVNVPGNFQMMQEMAA